MSPRRGVPQPRDLRRWLCEGRHCRHDDGGRCTCLLRRWLRERLGRRPFVLVVRVVQEHALLCPATPIRKEHTWDLRLLRRSHLRDSGCFRSPWRCRRGRLSWRRLALWLALWGRRHTWHLGRVIAALRTVRTLVFLLLLCLRFALRLVYLLVLCPRYQRRTPPRWRRPTPLV